MEGFGKVPKKKIRFPLSIKLYKDGGLVCKALFRKKTKLLQLIQVKKFDKGYLKVCYGNGLYNDCYFNDTPDLFNSFNLFMEKGIVDYVKGNNEQIVL